MSTELRGVSASLASSCMFGAMYYYATLLYPLNGAEIFGWRVLATLPLLTLLLIQTSYWSLVTGIVDRLKREPFLLLALILSAALFGVQFWLFLWGPVNGRALQVSLGYLLFPLVMVLAGRVFFGERPGPRQKAAVFLAGLGVVNQLYQVGHISWEALLVAFGFTAYFVLRKKTGINHPGGLWFDFLLIFPVAAYLALGGEHGAPVFASRPALYGLVLFLGVLSALSLACFTVASRLLPLGLFGMLSYVEPVLLVGVALLLGERILPQEIPTYVCIVAAIVLLASAAFSQRPKRRASQHSPPPVGGADGKG